MSDNIKNIKEEILSKIRTHEVAMRPKAYFTLKVGALAVVAFMVLVVSVFLCNFILFTVRLNSHDSLLAFGPGGIVRFLQLFPWSFLLLDVALIALLEWLVRQFQFGYKNSVIMLLFAILVVVASVSVFLDRGIGFNDELLRRADRHSLPPPFGDFYERARHAAPESGVYHGTVVAVQGETLMVRLDMSTTTITVVVPNHERVAVGERVFIFGKEGTSSVEAFGVRTLPHDDPFIPPPEMR